MCMMWLALLAPLSKKALKALVEGLIGFVHLEHFPSRLRI